MKKLSGKHLHKGVLLLSILLLALAIAGCGSKNANAGVKQLNKMPEMEIDPNKTYSAEFHTSKGDFTIDLYASDAPTTVNNFIYLAKQKFYDGVIFHRIIESFMIQTGDPTGSGSGGPGYNIPDELGSDHKYDVGTVAMANTGSPDSGGSQFFICTGPECANLNLQPNYTIFGQVTAGMDTVTAIAKSPVIEDGYENSKPKDKITIDSIDIKEK
ncbi:peptidyl-prolyl cis-trans isomerase cyclophilin type [Paenibacillus curdlanolyticus YK9]|uniref:Peptidyl-prolyl cis-trans isomerase n=1 Tax=Paenibacillus curdlanolyticus YK9 TaxID=717606 RepID=E0I527_9BACL|nr:peptidylprolyl isomerase [Paenibacillus curdlanolyticus]EFM12069.1 peptidyl-prolyl cis-trans isomerase cyclophilin type [Paenibacillus curdlanolyticus YK9]